MRGGASASPLIEKSQTSSLVSLGAPTSVRILENNGNLSLRWKSGANATGYHVWLIPVGYIGPVGEIISTAATSVTLTNAFIKSKLPFGADRNPSGFRVQICSSRNSARECSVETSVRVASGFLKWEKPVANDRPTSATIQSANNCLLKGGVVGAFAGAAALTFWIPGVDVVTLGAASLVFAGAAAGGGGSEVISCILG